MLQFQDGNVICIKESCPPLNCPLAERLPGQCCAQCQECTYKDRSYKNGAMWFSDDDSCTSCICHDGSVTCSELQCIVPCSNYVEEPDQCCPVCPSKAISILSLILVCRSCAEIVQFCVVKIVHVQYQLEGTKEATSKSFSS
ncbi:kielin/chordin-like protein [Octopus sinensis]|uniref:Kielin/chordin-like protein n=1 Tax=Octopus sinensis TaxID=2607531 RepID=A0A7E6EQE7_9MOLL|nr:kielin/chordin-like protein [Octopus sinensis]